MLMIIVSSSLTSMSMSLASTAAPSGSRSTPPVSTRSSGPLVARRGWSSCAPSLVSAASNRLTPSLIIGSLASSSGRRRLFELDGNPAYWIVLAERVALPVLRHQNAGQVGVTVETDAQQVVCLPLHGLGAGPELKEGRDGRIVLRHLDPNAQTEMVLE